MLFEHRAADPHDLSRTYNYYDFDLLRIQDGKIQDHWDSAKKNIGSLDFVFSETPPPSSWSTGQLSREEQHNFAMVRKALASCDFRSALCGTRTIEDPSYVEHSPDRFKASSVSFSSDNGKTSEVDIKKQIRARDTPFLLADRQYVLTMRIIERDDLNHSGETYLQSCFDLLRIDHGVQKEHWDDRRMPRTRMLIDSKVLSAYVGSYAVTPRDSISIATEGGQLFLKQPGKPQLPLDAESDNAFLLPDAEVPIEFVADLHGIATQLVVHQENRNIVAAKVH